MSTAGLPYLRREAEVLRPVVPWLRAGAILFGWLLIAVGQRPVDRTWMVVATVLLVGYVVWGLLVRPMSAQQVRAAEMSEALVALAAVLVSGGWASPYVLYLAIPVFQACVSVGLRALVLPGAYLAVLTMTALLTVGGEVTVPEVSQTLVPMVVAVGAGLLTRQLFAEADDEHSQTLGRIQQLSHVNALLSTLHDLVRSTPAPLTVEDVLQVIRSELDELFDADAVVLLLADAGGHWWRPVAVEGAALGPQLSVDDLPIPVVLSQTTRPVSVPDMPAGHGVTPHARAGAYLWLFLRGRPAALLGLEYHEPRELPEARLEVLERMSAPLGLAVDNAIWFQRLRTLGAEEERQRIGASLHDRFAQSLAYVNMELERLAGSYPDDPALSRLRVDVRATLADLRETLRELRLRCTEETGLEPTLRDHLERFGERFGVVVDLEQAGEVRRPPLSIENQLLRVTQDLLILAQREAGATAVNVTIASDPGRLRIVVRDDGRGVPEAELGHEASRILSLVRERADAIGGLVDVIVHPGEGTEVAVTLRGLS